MINISTLSILGRNFDIIFKEDINESGLCDYENSTIYIRQGQTKPRELDTLLHECIHAIDECMQTKLTERQVYCLAVGIIALLKDNKHMLEHLVETIKPL